MARIYPDRILGHWDHFIDGMRLSALDLYEAVEAAIVERGIAQVELERVTWPEWGVFSARRYHLQIAFDERVFVLSVIPIGNSTYVSWWCGLSERGLMAWLSNTYLLGWFFRPLFRPLTFFRIDTMRAFERALHEALIAVIDERTKASGARRMSAARRPIMRNMIEF
jgi:hypothetical protein